MNSAVESYILNQTQFTTEDFFKEIRKQLPNIGRSTIYKQLQTLCDEGRIVRVGKGQFTTLIKNEYTYELSPTLQKIAEAINKEFPLVEYQTWELYQLNEFVNHQISKNTLFVEVESMLDESIFNYIHNQYNSVLLNPSIDEYYKYMGDTTIVVQRLITESPAAYGEYKQASLEKIVVDLFGKGLVSELIEKAEYTGILEGIFSRYNINLSRLFRYARRRNVESTIREFISNKTDINMESIHDR